MIKLALILPREYMHNKLKWLSGLNSRARNDSLSRSQLVEVVRLVQLASMLWMDNMRN